MAVLLATAAATLFMTGVGWFVQVVHYPLMGAIGGAAFEDYHRARSRLTGRVVLGPMVIELAGSALLVAQRPAGVGALAAWAGVGALVAGSWLRTLAWTAHSGVVLGMLAAAA